MSEEPAPATMAGVRAGCEHDSARCGLRCGERAGCVRDGEGRGVGSQHRPLREQRASGVSVTRSRCISECGVMRIRKPLLPFDPPVFPKRDRCFVALQGPERLV